MIHRISHEARHKKADTDAKHSKPEYQKAKGLIIFQAKSVYKNAIRSGRGAERYEAKDEVKNGRQGSIMAMTMTMKRCWNKDCEVRQNDDETVRDMKLATL